MCTDRPRVGTIILAAGASTRLGRPKQLLQVQGVSLLRRTATIAREAGHEPVIVVLGAQAELLQAELNDLPVEIAINTEWEEGMASSLRIGIKTLVATDASIEAALILLCDQPLITPTTLQSLVDAYTAGSYSAVISAYDVEAIGPPCLFDHALFADLLTLQGTQGAKQIFSRLPDDQVAQVAFPEGRYDIDTPGDWELFIIANLFSIDHTDIPRREV